MKIGGLNKSEVRNRVLWKYRARVTLYRLKLEVKDKKKYSITNDSAII